MEKRYFVAYTSGATGWQSNNRYWMQTDYSEPYKHLRDANAEAMTAWWNLSWRERKNTRIEVVVVRECDLEEDLDAFDEETGEILDWTAFRNCDQKKGYVVNGKVRGK